MSSTDPQLFSLPPATAARRLPSFWPLAAAFGALWGSAEITLGSFLHTLKIPFAGAVLAGLGAGLLVAMRQVALLRGLCVATALIAALCKSMSPGGVILGPMVGIGVEGLLVELALLLAPRFLGSALAAGALAALWTVLQKLLTQALLYGLSALELYQALLRKGDEWIGRSGASLAIVAGILAGVALLGALLAGAGWRVGRDAALALQRAP